VRGTVGSSKRGGAGLAEERGHRNQEKRKRLIKRRERKKNPEGRSWVRMAQQGLKHGRVSQKAPLDPGGGRVVGKKGRVVSAPARTQLKKRWTPWEGQRAPFPSWVRRAGKGKRLLGGPAGEKSSKSRGEQPDDKGAIGGKNELSPHRELDASFGRRAEWKEKRMDGQRG